MNHKPLSFRKFYLVAGLLFINLTSYSQFTDTSLVDVIHYSINLDSVNIPALYIQASCKILYRINKTTSRSFFMLKSLSVDSIISNSGKLDNFVYKSPDIVLNYKSSIPAGDLDSLTVYYHGNPVSDSWGGFYFSNTDGGYAYNMGIGMNDFPHAYGRVWFPCIDLFTDRATYTIQVNTRTDQTAMSGGLLKSHLANKNGGITWIWEIRKAVPTDLVSIAIGPYSIVERVHQGVKRKYPVVFGVRAADSLNMLSSFSNLDQALDIFESKYGPYCFDKVGYSVVPFNSGAMEHSENISYPKSAVDGSKANENLWSHELSHSWWGNLVKCYTSPDMWLNEGWASYSEHVFTEAVYGRQAYLDNIHAEQKYVLQFAHINDDGPLPLSPLPTAQTYGTHAYQKGSVIVHTLRSYLGDSLFYLASARYLESMAFKNHNSYQLRDSFSKYTGINLTDFFNDWVFKPGFPHFEIIKYEFDKIKSEYTITIKQRSRFNSSLYHNVPLKVSFYNELFNRYESKIIINGDEAAYVIKTPWQAAFIALNVDLDISDAITKDLVDINTATNYSLKNGLMDITVKSLTSPARLLVEHHWIGPEYPGLKGIRLSDYRYWSVDGYLPAGFVAEATIRYNGVENVSADGSTYLDHTLNIINEDSLVLLYRPDKLSSWSICPSYTLYTFTNKTDKKGSIRINDLKKGDYCLGKYDFYAGLLNESAQKRVSIYPNPGKTELFIDLSAVPDHIKSIRLIDSSGKTMLTKTGNKDTIFKIDIRNYNKGIYIIEIATTHEVISEKVVIE